MTALALHGLRKTYPGAGQAAVHGLDLTVASGSLTALLGPSGCGKTTTMKLIAGLLSPDAGEVTLRPQVGEIFRVYPDKLHAQFPRFIPDMKVSVTLFGFCVDEGLDACLDLFNAHFFNRFLWHRRFFFRFLF